MPREIVTIAAGQCGNQISSQLWNLLMRDHGIDPASRLLTNETRKIDSDPLHYSDRKDIHFYQDDAERYVPRAILVDLEPRVITSVQTRFQKAFNPESIYVDHSGGGAGNNWATGYLKAEELAEELRAILLREAEACDSLEAFQLIHSISGGTGSGLGSWLLECLADDFPKVLTMAYSVAPNMNPNHAEDITVGPYNSVLTLKRLAEECDSVTIVDNAALHRIAAEKLHLETVTVEESNGVVADAIAGLTSGLRFPGMSFDDLITFHSQLVPMPRMQFLCTSLTPLRNVTESNQENSPSGQVIRRATPFDVLKKLQDPSNCLASMALDQPDHRFLSCINLIKGDASREDIWNASTRINDAILKPKSSRHGTSRITQSRLSFVPWVPFSIKVAAVRKSPYRLDKRRISGLMVGNNTGISRILDRVLESYDRLLTRQAFVDPYRKALGNLDEFYEASNIVAAVSSDYKNANSTDYLRRVFSSGGSGLPLPSGHADDLHPYGPPGAESGYSVPSSLKFVDD